MKYIVLSILVSLTIVGCSSTDPETEKERSDMLVVMDEEFLEEAQTGKKVNVKQEIVAEMEDRARVILGTTVRRLEDIRSRCAADIDKVSPPFLIEAVVPELKDLYAAEEAAYEDHVHEVTNRYLTELDKVIDYVVEKIWEVAFEVVGSEDVGTGYDTRTGIKDVDGIAEATIELVLFRAGRDEFVDDVDFLKRKRISLARTYKHDAKGRGRMLIYISDSLYRHHSEHQDGIACTIAFRSELSEGTPVEFRQAVRNRVTRGGANVYDSGFHWDASLGSPDGVLPLRPVPGGSNFIVSVAFLPRLNMDIPEFNSLRDYTAQRDFKTAVVNSETGEIIDCASWQLTWNISRRGVVSVDKGSPPLLDEEAQEIIDLLEGN